MYNSFFPRALPWAVAISGLQPGSEFAINIARRAQNCNSPGQHPGEKRVIHRSLKDCKRYLNRQDLPSLKLKKAFLFIFSLSFFFSLNASEQGRTLYFLAQGNMNAAFNLYDQQYIKNGVHDLKLIQKIGFALLEEGILSLDIETQISTLFGAGISGNDEAIDILERGIKSNHPLLQSVAINFLSQFQNDRAVEILTQAMSSNSLLIRLETTYHLAKNKHPKAHGQIESLMEKSPPEAFPLFPQILIMNGDKNSIRILKKLLTHANEQTRIETILTIAKHGRDDLLPEIRRLSSHLNASQQEACCAALGLLKDETSASKLLKLSESPINSVKLSALHALYRLGRDNVKTQIEELAKNEDLFAIYLMGEIPGSEPVLHKLIHSKQINVRINAAAALLKLHDPYGIDVLNAVFIKDKRDLNFTSQISQGKTLFAWKVTPSARQNYSDNPIGHEISLNMRQKALTESLGLPEKEFLLLAKRIFDARQNDLIPLLAKLLTNLRTPAAINLLKDERQRIGAPLIRNICNLNLYRAKEKGSYGKDLQNWILENCDQDLIQFQPAIPWQQHIQEAFDNQLRPEDATKILVESFESMIEVQDEKVIDTLLYAIRNGNKKNRYALAGLLMRAAH